MKKRGDEKGKNNQELHTPTLTNKQSEESPRASEERFRLLSEAAEEGIAIHDNGVIIEANEALARMFGYELSEMIGKYVKNGATPESWKIISNNIAKGYDKPYEVTCVRKDGATFVCSMVGKPYKYNDRTLRVSIFRDVTERKNVEKSLKESEARYRLLADNVTDVIFTIDMNFKYTFASPSVYNLVGYTADELTAMKVEELVDSETFNHFADLFAQELEMEKQDDRDLKRSRVLEYQHIRKDGSKVWVENKITFLRDENNKAIGILGIVRDITERKLKDDELRKSEGFFKEISENSSDIILITDENGIIKYCSPSMERFAGYKPEEVIGKNAFTFIHPEEAKRAVDEYGESLNRKDSFLPQNSFRIIHKDGSVRYFAGSGKVLLDNPDVAGVIMNVHDVTDQKLAEETLKQSTENYRKFFEEHAAPGIIIDPETGRILYVNHAAAQYYGWTREELLQMRIDQISTFSLEEIKAEIQKVLHHEKNRFEAKHRLADGSIRYVEVFSSKITLGGTDLLHSIVYDVTERKQAEEAGKQSEEKYRLLADHMKDQVWIMDMNLKVSYVSPSAEKLLGYTLEELRDLPLDKLLTAESLKRAMDFYQYELPKGLAAPSDYVLNRSLELQFCCKDGHTFWGETMFSFIRDENGKAVSILGEGRNITERKQMEDTLRNSEENFRHMLDDSPLGVRITTIEGKTLYANRAILDMYGYDNAEELENTPLKDRYTPESYAEFQERKKKRLKGETGPSEYEVSIVRKNGEIGHLYVFRKGIYWDGKKQSQVIYQDITLRRQAEEKLGHLLENLRQSIRITIQVLGTASEARDPYMAGHQKRVADLARAIATEMKLPIDKIEAIRMAGAIHDIGKISVPSEILCKPAILSDLEFSFIKNHPQFSYDIIKEVESPWPLADIVYQHHERIDGSGYPQGLKNEDILIESRIIAVADVVEAMMSYRPYRPALDLEIALGEIEKNAGILYDRKASEACLKLFREKGYKIS